MVHFTGLHTLRYCSLANVNAMHACVCWQMPIIFPLTSVPPFSCSLYLSRSRPPILFSTRMHILYRIATHARRAQRRMCLFNCHSAVTGHICMYVHTYMYVVYVKCLKSRLGDRFHLNYIQIQQGTRINAHPHA